MTTEDFEIRKFFSDFVAIFGTCSESSFHRLDLYIDRIRLTA